MWNEVDESVEGLIFHFGQIGALGPGRLPLVDSGEYANIIPNLDQLYRDPVIFRWCCRLLAQQSCSVFGQPPQAVVCLDRTKRGSLLGAGVAASMDYGDPLVPFVYFDQGEVDANPILGPNFHEIVNGKKVLVIQDFFVWGGMKGSLIASAIDRVRASGGEVVRVGAIITNTPLKWEVPGPHIPGVCFGRPGPAFHGLLSLRAHRLRD